MLFRLRLWLANAILDLNHPNLQTRLHWAYLALTSRAERRGAR